MPREAQAEVRTTHIVIINEKPIDSRWQYFLEFLPRLDCDERACLPPACISISFAIAVRDERPGVCCCRRPRTAGPETFVARTLFSPRLRHFQLLSHNRSSIIHGRNELTPPLSSFYGRSIATPTAFTTGSRASTLGHERITTSRYIGSVSYRSRYQVLSTTVPDRASMEGFREGKMGCRVSSANRK